MAEAYNPLAKPEYFKYTDRYKRIEVLQRVYDGKQYDGRADWWTGRKKGEGNADPRPLRERKPCIIYRLPKAATQQVVRFLFGDGKFPQIKVPEAKAEDSVGGIALSKEHSEEIQKWIAEFIERSRLKPVAKALATKGIACASAPVVMGLRNGEFRFETPRPQDCWPVFRDDDPCNDVVKLVWCYEFDKAVAGIDGKPETRRYLFRREWDETSHYVYPDVELKHGEEIRWPAPEVIPHGFSFCPVLWIRNEPEHAQGIDGCGLFEGLEEEFEALDFTMSQRHRGLAYLGTPQPYETGVLDGDGPDQSGRKASTLGYSAAANDNPHGAVMPAARRVAPDEIWSYEGEKVTLGLLETSGKSFEVATAHVNDIRSRVLETMGVVLTSMADTVSRVTAGSEMSAKFLALAHAPLISLVSEYRHAWWPHCLQAIISMAMRMVVELDGKQAVLIPGTEKVAKLLKPFNDVDDGGGKRWVAPKMEPLWGAFFDPSSAEIKQSVEAAGAAKDSGLVSDETAVRYIADDFGVVDTVAELETVKKETEEKQNAEDERNAKNADRELEAAAKHSAFGKASPAGRGGKVPKRKPAK